MAMDGMNVRAIDVIDRSKIGTLQIPRRKMAPERCHERIIEGERIRQQLEIVTNKQKGVNYVLDLHGDNAYPQSLDVKKGVINDS